ncbi:hypothetical protein [Benzoatithermus flavus]|uniref:Uncharacterized protein n=1 Tax=Benzoatithermus flavus TaxID=3108223 RepID=A0ABU8XM14_9PROT
MKKLSALLSAVTIIASVGAAQAADVKTSKSQLVLLSYSQMDSVIAGFHRVQVNRQVTVGCIVNVQCNQNAQQVNQSGFANINVQPVTQLNIIVP